MDCKILQNQPKAGLDGFLQTSVDHTIYYLGPDIILLLLLVLLSLGFPAKSYKETKSLDRSIKANKDT